MSDLALVADIDPEWAGRELAVRAADVARRMASVVEESCSPDSGAGEAVAFLTRWADSAVAHSSAHPVDAMVDHPLDLLAARYGLSDRECELILLAGLPEEHEGLAATFRSFHPQGEPRPTVGLAALVLGDGPYGRPMMRRLLAEGVAARGRLVRTAGNGALFEQSIVLADKLWDTLHGYDAWPSTLLRMPVDDAPVGLGQWLTG